VDKQKPVPVLVRLPKKVVNALDKSAKANCRSRSQEVKLRLVRSLEAREP
jgi:metal-responsive CopG/Arc/MetJ family transcriptional regulator